MDPDTDPETWNGRHKNFKMKEKLIIYKIFLLAEMSVIVRSLVCLDGLLKHREHFFSSLYIRIRL